MLLCRLGMEVYMHISPIDPITPAWDHMVRILFKPFAFKKWLALGFCAFLAQCNEQSASQGGNFWSQPGNANSIGNVRDWINSNFDLFITLLIVGVLVVVAIGLLTTWLSSRGKFMLLDGIVKNRGAVIEPWKQYKTEGNSLFFFTVFLSIALIIIFGVICGITALIALPDIQNDTLTGAAITAFVIGGLLLLLYMIACVAISYFMNALMIPTMYLKRVRAIEGWKIAWNQLLKGHVGSAILFFLMMFVLGIAAGIVGMLAICATCCIGALPYISSVLLLPITVFFACYVICYIQQFGSDWVFFKNMCPFCNYEMEGLEEGHTCPECGK